MLNIGFAFISSIVLIMVILRTNSYHGYLSYDNDLSGIQKYHTVPTSRIGGVGIFATFLLVLLLNQTLDVNVVYDTNLMLSVCIVFIVGVLEDLTKRITPMIRMSAIMLSAVIAIYVTHTIPVINYADFGYLDRLIAHYPIIGFLLSMFCIVGLTNAYNIIDGYNGLSSTTAMVNLIGLAILGIYLHDVVIIRVSLILLGSILGFWMFNYPWGKIFLGDGGAYTLGFIIALMSIYLIHEHKGLISPYAVLLMAIYPITEIGFSIYRRKFLRGTDGMKPDAMHLHQLIYHRCVPHGIKNRNSCVMPLMLFFIVPQTILAVLFYNDTRMCLISSAIYITLYTMTYFSIVRLRTFSFLKVIFLFNSLLKGRTKKGLITHING